MAVSKGAKVFTHGPRGQVNCVLPVSPALQVSGCLQDYCNLQLPTRLLQFRHRKRKAILCKYTNFTKVQHFVKILKFTT